MHVSVYICICSICRFLYVCLCTFRKWFEWDFANYRRTDLFIRITGTRQLYQESRMIRGIANLLFSVHSQSEKRRDPAVIFGVHLGDVVTQRDSSFEVELTTMSFFLLLRPCGYPKRLGVYIKNFPVYVDIARTCWNTRQDSKIQRTYFDLHWWSKTVHEFVSEKSQSHIKFEMWIDSKKNQSRNASKDGNCINHTNPISRWSRFGSSIISRSK